ncbi:MAG TPA: PASTA domain-containing protein, partial [Actinocrinis sp.]|nr:PASTA domain-containing protein [Actinocrinis sp.]
VSGYPDGMNHEERGPWHEIRQALNRLEGWHRGAAPPHADDQDDGDEALRALADGGLIRRMLDEFEFEAVRTARKHGKSWAEIAVKLGVTRQSAWERWRDVDDAAGPAQAARPARRGAEDPLAQVASDMVDQMLTEATAVPHPLSEAALSGRTSPGVWRRRSTVKVPDVVGMGRDRARAALNSHGLFAVGPDPDGPPLDAVGEPEDVVLDQSPESGAKVPKGTPVVLWIDRRGGSGVREPRRPAPDPKSARAMRDETTDEAVG